MKRIKFRTAASADMRRIARDTRAAWGEDQAFKYLRRMHSEIEALREFPMRHPEFDPCPGLRRMNSGRHAVVYLVVEDQVEIIRVLHAASDFEQWL